MLNKKISTGLGILIIIIFTATVFGAVLFFQKHCDKAVPFKTEKEITYKEAAESEEKDYFVDHPLEEGNSLKPDHSFDFDSYAEKYLPLIDRETYYNYKDQIVKSIVYKEVYNGIIGPKIEFKSLIAYGYFHGIGTFMGIEYSEKSPFPVRIDKSHIQIAGLGSDFYAEKFSPNGNFLLYRENLYVGYKVKIYDIYNEKIVEEFDFPDLYEFTPDEKYFYICVDSDYAGIKEGMIYNVPDFNLQYDLIKEEKPEGYYSIRCKYDQDRNILIYNIEPYGIPDETKIIEYSFNTGEATEIK